MGGSKPLNLKLLVQFYHGFKLDFCNDIDFGNDLNSI